MKIKKTLMALIILGVFVVLLASAVYLKNNTMDIIPENIGNKTYPLSPKLWLKKPSDPNNVRCTADVMQCPNGSYVGRIAPSCSFAPCPGEDKY